MFNHLLCTILLVTSLFISLKPLQAEPLLIPGGLSFQSKIITHLSESGVFDNFYSGDDGVGCDEPQVNINTIDYKSKVIGFTIGLNGFTPECYEVYYLCNVNFSYQGDGSIYVENKSIDPGKDCIYK